MSAPPCACGAWGVGVTIARALFVENDFMIVTIDGPAGAGKSSAARQLAERLGFGFLDTGSMYRAVTWAAIQKGVPLDDDDALEKVAREIEIQLDDNHVLVGGEDVTKAIRTFEITVATRFAADHPGVRQQLVERQREVASGRDFVTEGRDQGSEVFPDAECKIYLTADEQVRAERRYQDLVARGEKVTFDEVFAKQQDRDLRDATRHVGALTKANDAIEVVTDGLSPDEVVDRLVEIVQGRRRNGS
jgi:CMP/dCMP kinase